MISRHAGNEGPEPYALDHAAHTNGTSGGHGLRSFHQATVPLPSDLDHSAVLHQNRHHILRAGEILHPAERRAVVLDVVFDKLHSAPLEPVAHLLRMRTPRRAIELKPRHGDGPPVIRE